ncbi:hypothetical protein H9P43_007758 [Blastocladiella emersonii ATCC 22665]|nr:hypothetical protein H9P43_007758 [Blastocladiella emersonii ATCC 22665]
MVASKEHCYYCFEVLVKHLDGEDAVEVDATEVLGDGADAEYPLFVTWNISTSHRGRNGGTDVCLRGCIGNFSAQPLGDGLREYAVVSAVRDTRFSPIGKHELARLSCSVSLLVDFEDAAHPLDWVVGEHGIRIFFRDPRSGKAHSATYLPEIAREQGWDHVAALDSLIRKSGYAGPIDDELRDGLRVVRYRSAKAKCTYAEYLAWAESRLQGDAGDDEEDDVASAKIPAEDEDTAVRSVIAGSP